MVDTGSVVGWIMLLAGVVLFAFELFHPGALLLIPGSVLLAAGALYLFLPNVLLNSWIGVVVIVLAAIAAALAEIPFYRHLSPGHAPMTTTVATLVGREAVVVAPVVPDTLRGKVRVGSEIWSATGAQPIAEGTRVRVVAGEGVALRVEPILPGTKGPDRRP
ncbi:MAG: NfeD family protein [Thermoplasmata archaeon]